ncbi:MAG: TolC family outer membrane protein [Thiotrichales bacterium]|nr:TolC family outer membrane protein [Thiotrichales bacterium]
MQSPIKKLTRLLLMSTLLGSSVGAQAATSGLLDIYRMAVDYDPVLSQAKAQFAADQQQLKALEGGLYPQINAGWNLSKTEASTQSRDVGSSDLTVTVNQALYQNQLWARIDQSKSAVIASEVALQTAEQALILQVTEAYFAVLLAKQTLALFKSREEADLLQLESAKASAEVGLSSQVDVLQAQSSYDLSKSNRINAENSLDLAEEALLKITGQPFGSLKALPLKVELPSSVLDLTGLEQQAQQQNLTVIASQAQAEIARQEIEVQKSGDMPVVAAQARFNDTRYDQNTFEDYSGATLGLNVTLPLYTGGTTQASINAARAQNQKSLEALRAAKNQARLDARSQVRNIERGESLIAALREAVKSNNAFLEAAEEGYKVGLRDLLEVFSARANQVDAMKNLLEAQHNQVLNRLRLESVLGDLTPEDLQVFDTLLTSSPENAS